MEKAETDKVFASSIIFQLIALHENEKKNVVNVIVSLKKKILWIELYVQI